MKTTLKLLAFLIAVCGAADAQVAPAATGPRGLPVSGNLKYALRYGQTAQFGNSLGNWQTSNISGSLEYANGSPRLPFTVDYTGGYTWTVTGPDYASGLFQHMLLSQGVVWKRWTVLAKDDISYLPQSPTTGFSGIPGTGETIGGTNPAPSSSQTIVALNTHVINNVAAGEVTHNLNFSTTMSVGGGSELLRFPDNDGLNTNTLMGHAAIGKRLDARNSIMGTYQYSSYTYPGSDASFESNVCGASQTSTCPSFLTSAGLLGYEHKWSRTFTTDVSAGPQWLSSSNPAVVPSSTNVTANASANFVLRFTSANVTYTRSTNGGGGYLPGGEIDVVQGGYTHEFGMNMAIGLTEGYERTAGLNNNGVTISNYGGAQATRRFGRNLIVFASYTGIGQTSTSALPTNALNNQLLQVIGFGIGYSPRETHLRQ